MEDDARVTDGTMTFELTESQYRARGYKPEFDRLPLCGDPGSEAP
jgi:hypothetical protein